MEIMSNTGYKGISLEKSGKYSVKIRMVKKSVFVGNFNTLDEAIKAYEKRKTELLNGLLKIEDLPNEIWKDIVNYEGLYQISNMGRVKNIRDGKERLSSTTTNNYKNHNYESVKISKNDIGVSYHVHRLVAEHFLTNNLHKGIRILHIDGNSSNNKATNLKLVTPRESTTSGKINPTGYTGVTKSKSGRYRSKIKNSQTQKYECLGTFDSAKEASEAYQKRKAELDYNSIEEIERNLIK